jgi:diguanylate cyclase (GGDEF)-like protein
VSRRAPASLRRLNARLRENERQLQALAHTDPLTGLANRLLLDARLEQSMQHARRSHGQIALLLVDLDEFKSINDSRGHAIGDEVLRATAERLRAAVREVDTVARVGGDEFVVVLTALGGASDAERLAEKLVDRDSRTDARARHAHRVQRQRWRRTCSAAES